MKHIRISSTATPAGFTTSIDKKNIQTVYPNGVWKSVPGTLQNQIAQTISYFVTRHLAVSTKASLHYNFPPPTARLFIDYGFFYAMTEAPFEFPEKKLTTEGMLKSVYNSEFSVFFKGIPESLKEEKTFSGSAKHVVMPISFGKDSLLTFALSRELGLHPHPIFMEEPTCPYQNKKKRGLIQQFTQEFSVNIAPFANTLGDLRQAGGMMWGWDMLLAQYTMLMLPFIYKNNAAYFFWSNEQSTNEHAMNKDGYIINSTHEQSVQWVLHLNNAYRGLGVNTTISSLLEPLHELFILSILHKRYPEVGKYQLSCDGEKTTHRWCGKCFECARLFLFYSALGIDPRSVGLMDNMFTKDKKDLYYLFSKKDGPQSFDIVFQSYPERLLAFYLAYKRGVKGALMDEFVKTLLPQVEKQKSQLFSKYFTIHEMHTIPTVLQAPLKKIYDEELKRMKKELT